MGELGASLKPSGTTAWTDYLAEATVADGVAEPISAISFGTTILIPVDIDDAGQYCLIEA